MTRTNIISPQEKEYVYLNHVPFVGVSLHTSAACKLASPVLGKMICLLFKLLPSLPSFHGARNGAKVWGKIPWTWYKKMVDNGENACSQQRWHWLQYFPIYLVLFWCIKPSRKKIQQVRTVLRTPTWRNFRFSDDTVANFLTLVSQWPFRCRAFHHNKRDFRHIRRSNEKPGVSNNR